MKVTVVMANDYLETVLSGGEKENEKVIKKIEHQLNTNCSGGNYDPKNSLTRSIFVRGYEFEIGVDK
tara:strand:+ start:37 stop:237 length:201 start_codon:yes stop_codon:yes gene_type:complete